MNDDDNRKQQKNPTSMFSRKQEVGFYIFFFFKVNRFYALILHHYPRKNQVLVLEVLLKYAVKPITMPCVSNIVINAVEFMMLLSLL